LRLNNGLHSRNSNTNYNFQEHIGGVIIIENKHELKHEGVFLSVQGFADIRFNLRTISFIDTFYGSDKSIPLTNYSKEICGSGRLSAGRIEIP
jgi:hypothetical protein